MNDRDTFDSVAIRPTRVITVLYAVVKQVVYMLFIEGDDWIPRGIASIILMSVVFFLTSRKKLTNRQMSVLVPYSAALSEIVFCSVIGGDRLVYIFLMGCSLFSLMYIDTTGLLIMMLLTCCTVAFFGFGLGINILGANYIKADEVFNFIGLVVIDILIFLIGKFSVGTLARFRRMGKTFNIIMNNSPNHIAVINEEARVEYISKSLADWLNIDKREYAVNMPFINLLPTNDLKQLFGDLLRRKEPIEHTFVAAIDGRQQWFILRSIMTSDSGTARIFEWMDITPIKEAQRAAESAALAKSEFLAKMSHEIRTPMNAIIGITELVLREELPAVVYEYSRGIKNAGNNLLSIINDILDFSKIESGKLEITSSEYLFASLINDVINIIRIRTTEKSVFFVVNLDSAIPNRLIGDEVRIRQIVLNLLSNAVKYTYEGFISLTIVGEMKDDNTVLLNIEVSDSGIGIKPEDMDKLFGNFVQIDLAVNKGIQGTGLGLAITKSLCLAMGGDISVRSEYGKGSTFNVVIPQKFTEYEKFASVLDPSGKKVLLYELRETYADSIARSFDNLGVECVLAHSREEFYEEVKNTDFLFIFVSSFLFEDTKNIINELEAELNLVLLAEYGEIASEENVKTIAMPVHSISIANIINNVTDNAGYSEHEYSNISFSAPSARVLIVDDIPTNLKVAEGLMLPYNMQIDTCLSGETSIEMVKSYKYDMIFMDHMMPVMDGVEAVRRIRALRGEYYTSVPIIALTANAISGVKEMYIQNGMNDFLAKPIEMSKLNSILEKWIPREKREKEITVKTVTSSVPFTVEGVDVNAGLNATGGDVDRYIATLSLFCTDSTENISQIKISMQQGNIRLYTTYVHALKSTLAVIGAKGLSDVAKRLEVAGLNSNKYYILQNTDSFLQELTKLIENISNAVLEARESVEIKDKIDEELLVRLKTALNEMDAATIGDTINELCSQNLGKGLNEVVQKINRSILMFEYDEAQSYIDELLGAVK